MDFIPIIKEIPVTAATAIDVSDYNEKGIAGVMFYVAVTVTISDGTNSIAVYLDAYNPLRITREMSTITSDTTTTMIRGGFDTPGY